jgi:CRISPR system Cascade subunit CasD
MTVLLMRLTGPMQSWGTQSRFTTRDTGLEPSKSGVIGLLCAALGFPRSASELDVAGRTIRMVELAALSMGVRVDREGTLARDFHTAGGGTLTGKHDGPHYGVVKASGAKGTAVVSTRYYLADADFLVALGGEAAVLERLHAALQNPVWPLSLGRKSFVPGEPVWILNGGLTDADCVEAALRTHEWKRPERAWEKPDRLRLVLETDDPSVGEPRNDVPLSFDFEHRKFSVRHVRADWINDLDALPDPAVPSEPSVPPQTPAQETA